MQYATIQQLTAQVEFAQRPWAVGSIHFFTVAVAAMAAVVIIPVCRVVFLRIAFAGCWSSGGFKLRWQPGADDQERDHEQEQEQDQESSSSSCPEPDSTTTFKYSREKTRSKSKQEIIHRIRVYCPPGGGVLDEHFEFEDLAHGIKIRVSKPGDNDLPAIKWEHAFHFNCEEGEPIFEHKPEENSFENDVLDIVFKASLTRRISKLKPHSYQDHDDRDWHDMAGGDAPVGLYTLPETSEVDSHPSRRSGPACLQRPAMQHLEQMSETSQSRAKTEASHLSSEPVDQLRNTFQQFQEDMLDTSQTEMVASSVTSETYAMPQDFDIHSDAGQVEMDASCAPSEASEFVPERFLSEEGQAVIGISSVPNEPGQIEAESLQVQDPPEAPGEYPPPQDEQEAVIEDLPVQSLQAAHVGPVQVLENKAQSEVSSSCQDWEKLEIFMDEMEQSP